jgi:hypothetical protein
MQSVKRINNAWDWRTYLVSYKIIAELRWDRQM